jgi:FkbM family methyltransferase
LRALFESWHTKGVLVALKGLVKKGIYALVPPPRVPASYSQAGEDAVLRFLFAEKKHERISYLDVGTNAADTGNNTYLFYCSGSNGVCVEADKTLVPHIAQVRPRDTILNVGVSPDEGGEAEFYVFDHKGINTFDKSEANKRAASGHFRLVEVAKVRLVNINSILREQFVRCPDLLSLDIEGLDLPVLKSLDFEKYPIPVICAETCAYSENHIRPKDTAIADFLRSKGYEIYADTHINTIFVRSAWFRGSA